MKLIPDPFTLYTVVMLSLLSGAVAFLLSMSCGSSMDLTELARIRAITCPSVCAAYADAVDAGVEITPEDEALIGVCSCP